MQQYGNKDYWDKRYKTDPEPFEWYQKYITLKPTLLTILQGFQSPRILIIGCGNSRLSEELYNDGYKQITNIDFSEVCINQMQERYSDYDGMKYYCMNICNLSFDNAAFDVVIDKGTLDSVLCGDGATEGIHKALKEVSRIMNYNGVFVCISYGVPEYRLPYFENSDERWSIEIQKIRKPMIDEPTNIQNQDDLEEQYHHVYIGQLVNN